jgi:hypothetical protein
VVCHSKWIERIKAAWGKQVDSIIETGNLLEAAKGEKDHGEWMNIVKTAGLFSHQTAAKLMKIADDEKIRNHAPGRNLPNNWTILYELTHLTSEEFDVAIKSGKITEQTGMAKMTGKVFSENSVHNGNLAAAAQTWQQSAPPGSSAATYKAADIAYGRTCLASAIANNCATNVFVNMLRELGTGGQ